MKSIIHSISVALTVFPALVYYAAAGPEFSDWSAPVNLGEVVNSRFDDAGPAIAKDGLSLYFNSDRPGGFGGIDIWVSQRANANAAWGTPVNLGPNVNTPFNDVVPALSRDGHWMFLASNRPGGFGAADIWASWRANTHDDFGWQPPVNLGPGVNTASFETGPSFFQNDDGTGLLYFTSDRPGGAGAFDIYVSALAADGTFGDAALVPELNSPDWDQRPVIRSDGLEIFLLSNRPGSFGGGERGFDIWASTRQTVFDTWSPPVNLGPIVNSHSNDQQAYPSADGLSLYFASDRPHGFRGLDLYVTTREKVDESQKNRDAVTGTAFSGTPIDFLGLTFTTIRGINSGPGPAMP